MMPVLFLSHGSPMLALATPEDDPYVKTLRELGRRLEKPKAVAFVSPHWYAVGNFVDVSARPKTIYDFYGFPEALSRITYPAPGYPDIVAELDDAFGKGYWKPVERGLDHAVWTTLAHLYPEADVPVVSLSVDSAASPEAFLEMGKRLRPLREKGFLIVGGGNLVHNLSSADFSKGPGSEPYAFAKDFDAAFQARLDSGDRAALARPLTLPGGAMSVPTPEHYLPALVTIGASFENERPETVFDGFELGSIGRRSFGFGLSK